MVQACDPECLFKNLSAEQARALISNAVNEGMGGLSKEDLQQVGALLTDWRSITRGTKETAQIILYSIWRGAARLAGLCILAYIAYKMGITSTDAVKRLVP